MKNLILSIFLVVGITTVKSQCNIDTAVIVKFTPPVSVRVNEVARHITLSVDEQLRMGTIFQGEDSLKQQCSNADSTVLITDQTREAFKALIGAERFDKLQESRQLLYTQTDENSSYEERRVYLESRFALMQSAKPISHRIMDDIAYCFDSLSFLQKGLPLHDLFMEALYKHAPDPAYFAVLFEKEINEDSFIRAYHYMSFHKVRYNLEPETCSKILSMAWERNKAVQAINYTYRDSAMRVETATPVIHKYNRALQSVLEREAINTPQNLFFDLVYYKRVLKLTATQVDSLIARGYEVAGNQDAVEDRSLVFDACRSFFRDNFTEEQFNEVLLFVFRDKAKKMTDNCADEIITAQKIPEIGYYAFKDQLFQYHLAVCLTEERFKDTPEDLQRRLAILEETAPYAYKVHNRIPVNNKRNTGTYMW